ncbi:MAG TPA: hypothetical protein VL088_08060, partial [Pedobacter sp.]|nr:hypothetical protein [Pedobacter sp.]
MKIKNCYTLFVVVLIFAACKKDGSDEATRPVKFTETTYQNLGTFDNAGHPGYLLTKDAISPNLLSYINTTMPEKDDLRKTHPELLSSSAIADITITQSSDVFITFVSQGTALADAIAFYTYPTNQPLATPKDIKTITYIFPNAGA